MQDLQPADPPSALPGVWQGRVADVRLGALYELQIGRPGRRGALDLEHRENVGLSFKTVVGQLKRERDAMREALKEMTDDAIEDLVRRGQHRLVDGLPTSSMGGSGGGDVSRPTESAALRNAAPPSKSLRIAAPAEPDSWQSRERDNVAAALNTYRERLHAARVELERAQRSFNYVMHADARARGRCPTCDGTSRLQVAGEECEDTWHITSPDCAACHRPVSGAEGDRLAAGYCSECFELWGMAGRPDRRSFEVTRTMCAECGASIFVHESKTLDERSYHHPDQKTGCYWRAYNRSRGRRGA